MTQKEERMLFRKKPKATLSNKSQPDTIRLKELSVRPLTGEHAVENLRDIAGAVVARVFKKETEIFKYVAEAFIRVDIEPTVGTKDVQISGMGMGNPGELGCLQALTFSRLFLEHLKNISDQSMSVGQGAKMLTQHPESRGLLVENISSKGINKDLVNKMLNIVLELLE